MPEAFERCVKLGGRVRTKSLKKGKYLHVCFHGGKSYPGYVKMKKESPANRYTKGLKDEN